MLIRYEESKCVEGIFHKGSGELSTFQHVSTKEKKKQKKKISSTSTVNIFQDLTYPLGYFSISSIIGE